MNILREGANHLIIQSDNCAQTFNNLAQVFKFQISIEESETIYEDYLSAVGLLDDSHTVLLISKEMKPKLSFEYGDFSYVAIINKKVEELLIEMIKYKEHINIKNLRSAPRLIMMRTTGDNKKYVDMVNKDIDGSLIRTDHIHDSKGHGTIIMFTEKKLKGPIGMKDFYHYSIYSQESYNDLAKHLSNNSVKYVNASIDNKDWAELIIKIYDSYERYDVHYKRLSMVLNELDCGLILGESWGRDAALAFHSVGVYQIRLFTYLEPLEIKKITLGLEYDNDGNRIVDYDLFKKRKKLSWSQVRNKEYKKRDDLGFYYRKKLVKELTEDTKFELMALELKLRK